MTDFVLGPKLPLADCSRCKGAGKLWYRGGEFIKPHRKACLCTYVDHDLLPIAREVLSTTIAKLRKELRGDD